MFAGVPPLDPLSYEPYHVQVLNRRSDQISEPPLSHPGASPDADRAQPPPLLEPPYHPYSSEPTRPEPPYKPYVKEPPVPGLPYEPYKGI